MASLTRTVAQTVKPRKFRPLPPQDLVKRIVNYLSERLSPPFDTAVDVACGTGKSTEALSPYFRNVIGIKRKDIQENYAYRSVGLYNIVYSQGSAEQISCLNNSVQLVTASQSAHWFDLTKFFSETERVLCPGGVLAIYGYSLPSCVTPYEEINNHIDHLMKSTLSDYMPKQSKTLYLEKYNSEDFKSFLFNKEPIQRDESSFVELKGTISDLINYIRSTATFQNYESINGPTSAFQMMQKFEHDLMDIVGSNSPDDKELKIIFNFVLLMGRKPF